MQRGTYTIALSESAVEGGLVARGETQPAFNQSVLNAPPGTAPEARQAALLEAFLQQAQWEEGWAVLVLPTAHISIRRLHFAFSDPKKIRQVLPLELESELLDGAEQHAYDIEILRRPDGSADALVYLADKEELRSIEDILEAHSLNLQRATFSAQLLAQGQAPPAGRHFCVYVGSDESFVAYTLDGRLMGLTALLSDPGELLAGLQALGPGSPYDQLQALYRAGPEDEARASLRDKLHERLGEALEEINRYVRINSAGEAYTVSPHGMFGELLQCPPGGGTIGIKLPAGSWPGARRSHFGVLDEILAQPKALTTPRALNFHRRVATWLAMARELRWPLTAAATLLVVLAGLLGTGYWLRASALESRLTSVNHELQRTLKVRPPLTSVTINAAMGRVQEQLAKLRKDREAVAYLDRYHYDTLNLFKDLSQVVHDQTGITVDAMSFTQDRLLLSGTSPSYTEAEALRNRIGAMPRFKGRTVKVTNSNVGQQIRYRLTVER